MSNIQRANRSFVIGLLLGSISILLLPVPSAYAVTCQAPGGHGIVAHDADLTNWHGTKVSANKVYNSANQCDQVRSLYISADSTSFVETGWYDAGSTGGVAKCDEVTTPHLLVYALVNGFVKCKKGTPALTAGQSYSMNVQNPAGDHTFEYYFQGASEGSYNTNFAYGLPEAGSERHLDGEDLKADFTGLQKMQGPPFGTFQPWQQVAWTSDVTGWRACVTQPNNFTVRQAC
ncbi:MAG: hypothetical protein ACXWEJ_00880 [Actinomycetota bacterium]